MKTRLGAIQIVLLAVVGLIAAAYAEKAGNGSIFSFVRRSTETGVALSGKAVGGAADLVADAWDKVPEGQEQKARMAASQAPAPSAAAPVINLSIMLDGKQIEALIPQTQVSPQGTVSTSGVSSKANGS